MVDRSDDSNSPSVDESLTSVESSSSAANSSIESSDTRNNINKRSGRHVRRRKVRRFEHRVRGLLPEGNTDRFDMVKQEGSSSSDAAPKQPVRVRSKPSGQLKKLVGALSLERSSRRGKRTSATIEEQDNEEKAPPSAQLRRVKVSE